MLSTFAGHVGEEFQLHDRSGELHPVELVDAIGQASRQATEEQPTDTSSFSIVFHDPGLPPSRTWSSRCIESSTPSSANSTCSLFPSVPMQTETECNMRQFSRRLANTTEQYTSDTSSFLQSWHGALVEHRTVGPLFLLCRGSFSFRVPADLGPFASASPSIRGQGTPRPRAGVGRWRGAAAHTNRDGPKMSSSS